MDFIAQKNGEQMLVSVHRHFYSYLPGKSLIKGFNLL